MADDNMRIWNQVQTTDPTHTKVAKLGGRVITSIDAMYQIKRATEVFGPVGDGWTYTTEFGFEKASDEVTYIWCDVVIRYNKSVDGSWCSFGPVRGLNLIRYKAQSGRQMEDEDAPKKAMTDALTKALSHLGFSADVFLGMYDDNKYVAGLKTEFAAKKAKAIDTVKAAAGDLSETMKALVERIEKSPDHAALDNEYKINKQYIAELTQGQRDLVLMTFRERRQKLNDAMSGGDE